MKNPTDDPKVREAIFALDECLGKKTKEMGDGIRMAMAILLGTDDPYEQDIAIEKLRERSR